MKYLLIIFLTLGLTGCSSFRSLYPIGGAIVGGGIGSLGGPGGAALGAGAGAAVGEILEGDGELSDAKEEVEEAKEVIEALSKGDVDKLVQLKLEEQKGTFDKVIDGIYRILWLLGIAAALWFILPIIWAKWHVRKTVKKHVEEINGKDTSDT